MTRWRNGEHSKTRLNVLEARMCANFGLDLSFENTMQEKALVMYGQRLKVMELAKINSMPSVGS
jgi:hypothetical protein